VKISLLTDAPKHNLALMKISAWHKANGDDVMINAPVFPSDYKYASILFERNINKFIADKQGGPAIENSILEQDFEYIGIDQDQESVDIGNKRALSAEPQLF